mgnify:CR=1 FL=1
MRFNFWKFFFIWLVILSPIIFIVLLPGLSAGDDLGAVIFAVLFFSIPVSFAATFIFKWIIEKRFSRIGGGDTSPISIHEVGEGYFKAPFRIAGNIVDKIVPKKSFEVSKRFSLYKPSMFISIGVLIMVVNIGIALSITSLAGAGAGSGFGLQAFLVFFLVPYSAIFLIYIAILLIRTIQGRVPWRLSGLVLAGCLLSIFLVPYIQSFKG